jgi:hypothetical protein
MGEVIYVDFYRPVTPMVPNPLWQAYVDTMRRNGICEDDIEEVTDAVRDKSAYESADSDIKMFADVWFDWANAI